MDRIAEGTESERADAAGRLRRTSALLTASVAFSALPVLAAEPRFELPLPASPLNLVVVEDRLFVCLGLHGLAWLEPAAQEGSAPTVRVEDGLPTLDVAPLGEGRFLAAGRDSRFRTLRFMDEPGDGLEVLAEWQAEGIPTGVAVRGNLLAVASGGAGLGLWEFRDASFAEPARLVGRFPFAEYAKGVRFLDEDHVAVTDAHVSALWVVNVSEPRIPRRTQNVPVPGYCDFVDASGEWVAFTDRIFGVHIGRLAQENDATIEQHAHLVMRTHRDREAFVNRIAFDGERLLVTESHFGTRLFEQSDGGERWRVTHEFPRTAHATDAVVWEDSFGERWIVQADGAPSLRLFRDPGSTRESDSTVPTAP